MTPRLLEWLGMLAIAAMLAALFVVAWRAERRSQAWFATHTCVSNQEIHWWWHVSNEDANADR